MFLTLSLAIVDARSSSFDAPPARGGYHWADSMLGGSKVRRSCQSTIVGGACTELHHSDRNLRTA